MPEYHLQQRRMSEQETEYEIKITPIKINWVARLKNGDLLIQTVKARMGKHNLEAREMVKFSQHYRKYGFGEFQRLTVYLKRRVDSASYGAEDHLAELWVAKEIRPEDIELEVPTGINFIGEYDE